MQVKVSRVARAREKRWRMESNNSEKRSSQEGRETSFARSEERLVLSYFSSGGFPNRGGVSALRSSNVTQKGGTGDVGRGLSRTYSIRKGNRCVRSDFVFF